MTTRMAAAIVLLIIALLCWAHLGALLEIERSSFLRFIALTAAMSTSYLGMDMLRTTLRAQRQERARRAECRARTIWPGA